MSGGTALHTDGGCNRSVAGLQLCWRFIFTSALTTPKSGFTPKQSSEHFAGDHSSHALDSGLSRCNKHRCLSPKKTPLEPHFTIFIVDDDAAVLEALSGLLQDAGYGTKEYNSAEIFLSEHDASIPGCILMDLVMPGMNGLDVQEVLARKGIDRPMIFVTGKATILDSVQAMRADAIDFLTKPVELSKLLNAIKSAKERDTKQRHLSVRRNGVLEKMAQAYPP